MAGSLLCLWAFALAGPGSGSAPLEAVIVGALTF